MAVANLAVRFLLEVAGIAALAFAGFQLAGEGPLRIVAAVLAPAVLIVAWALVVAPNADNGLSQALKDVIGTVILLLAAATLWVAGQAQLAIGLGVLVLVNAVLLFAFGQEARNSFGAARR